VTVEIPRSHTNSTDTSLRTPPNKWPARRKFRYLLNTQRHKRRISMRLTGFIPAIRGKKPLEIYTSDLAASRFEVAK